MAGVRVVLKVAVLGGEKTGKTSIIQRYVDGKFLEQESRSSTGIDFRQKEVTVNGLEYSYEIWDVSNWTNLDNLGLNFWKDINGCALVFDMTKAYSFNILDDIYRSVLSVTKQEDLPLIVVGTMADKDSSIREVSGEVVESWCNKICTMYHEVSCKSGFGVSEMFQALAERAVLFYQHHHAAVEQSCKKSSRFSMARPFHKVSSKFKLGRAVSVAAKSDVQSDYDMTDKDHKEGGHQKKKKSKRKKQIEELNAQLDVEKQKSEKFQEDAERYEEELTETKKSMEHLHNKLQVLQRNLREKVALCASTEATNQILQRQVADLQLKEKNIYQGASQWEINREEVILQETKIIGTGAWGYVVEGSFRGQKVAVKCLHSLIQQPQFLQVMRREIEIMAQLRHPHLLLFMAVVLENETGPLIVTELLDTSLRHAYERNQLQQSDIMSIFREVAAALNYLHLQGPGIIHRDVSSANVLLEKKSELLWKAKVSDFGSANLIRQCSTIGPGAIVYAAPELKTVSDVPQTPKVDVYSFGVLVVEVLLHQFPSIEDFRAMLETLKPLWPNVHSLTYRCTKDKPTDRPTMAMVLEELNHLTLT